ncbi:MAG: hypothetical protein M1820_000084 [Bogoriella megaspora]|nr:MAG: hypothetical protein M1820_000084 [Bogoriella megaspora]
MSRIKLTVAFSSIWYVISQATESAATQPLSIPASEYWDGVDGSWSTFWVSVGNPPQQVRVLPSTSGDHNALWVVLPEGCTEQDPSSCSQNRTVFYPNSSSSWNSLGLYHLGLREEALLGLDVSLDNAEFAVETFTLGNGNGLPAINASVVQGFATKDFYMGLLGLTARAVNVTNFNSPKPSPIQSLRDQGSIPSLSWGYTAGAPNIEPPTFASLTLGGYDSNRFLKNNITINFGADQSRDLLVGIQSISDGENNLLPTSVYAFIDSIISELWLPIDACQAFEQAFDLTWNDTAELYSVNDTTHNNLLTRNPNITFKIGPSDMPGAAAVDITMPYSAFDMTITPPYVGIASRYFPLKRANESTQYTLGRTFLQYAYLVVDYERSNFSVSQALFPSTSMQQSLTAIHPPDYAPWVAATAPLKPKKNHFSSAAIAGIVIGAAGTIGVLGLVTLLARRYRRRAIQGQIARIRDDIQVDQKYEKPELDANANPLCFELDETSKHEMGRADGFKAEMDAGALNSRPELEGTDRVKPETGHYELDSSSPNNHLKSKFAFLQERDRPQELPSDIIAIAELPSIPFACSQADSPSGGLQSGSSDFQSP